MEADSARCAGDHCTRRVVRSVVWRSLSPAEQDQLRDRDVREVVGLGLCSRCYGRSNNANPPGSREAEHISYLRPWPLPGPWVDDALCAQTDPDLFFPDKGQPSTDAVALCQRCPVATECLDYALTHETTAYAHGIWGGTTSRQRQRLRDATNQEPAA